MRLYLIRHADPDYPNNTITEFGHKEAAALAPRLAAEQIDRIYSSPLNRARETAGYTAKLMGHEVGIEDWTTELHVPATDMEAWGKFAFWNLPGEVIRGGETLPGYDDWSSLPYIDQELVRKLFEDVKAASDAFFARHGYQREGGRYRCVTPNRERIAVFCHGGFGLAWLAHLLEIPFPLMWSGFWLPPSSVTTIFFDQRSEDWAVPRCVGLGDVSHLYAAGLPVRPRGILGHNWYKDPDTPPPHD